MLWAYVFIQYNYVEMEQGNHEKEEQFDAISYRGKCGTGRGYCHGHPFCFERLC